MKRKLICFIAILSMMITGLIPFQEKNDSVMAYAAEKAEYQLPVGGVSEDTVIEVDWDAEWIAKLSGTKKRGGEKFVESESKDPNGQYSDKKDGSGTYGYDNLTVLQKMIYEAAKDSVEDFIGSDKYDQNLESEENAAILSEVYYTGDQKCTFDDLNTARVAFRYDNPQYFFLDSDFSWTLANDGSYSKLILYVDKVYYTSKSRKEAQDSIDELAPEWIDAMQEIIDNNPDNGEYLATVYAHNLIIERIDYAYKADGKTPQDARWAHSMAGVFTAQGVVCEGYAKAFQYLLNMCGIDNIYIVGRSTGRDSGHAWNCFRIGDTWYPVDLTWDDRGNGNIWYSYFAIPGSVFVTDHIADNMGQPGMYKIPAFCENDSYSYYRYFKGYGNNLVSDDASAAALYDAAAAEKPDFTDYLYFSVSKQSELQLMMKKLNVLQLSYSNSPYFGMVFRVEYTDDIKVPATSITLSEEKITVAVDETAEITATIAEDSDDRVAFSLDDYRFCSIRKDGTEVIITGKKNGKATLTARTVAGKAKAVCEITIGTGIPDPDDVYVWQNGGKDYKKYQIVTSLTATSWKDSKGKTKPGKLVWIASDENITIEFDTEKHKVETKTKPTKGSVNSKGIVTAKEAGRLYVYCCDTGSFRVEKTVVEVLASPSKLLLGSNSSVTEAKDALKKLNLNVGETGRVYICPFVKNGTADEANEYTVSLAKNDQAKYVALSDVMSDGSGGIYFQAKALDFDRSKVKSVSVKVVVQCKQSGKKATVSVVISNPVTGLELSEVTGKTTLAKKKESLSMKLNLSTYINDLASTTDKLKVYVGNSSVTLNSDGKKVEADKGATVKAKFDAKTRKLTLTAGKDAGETAVVYLASTNQQTKKTVLYPVLQVGADGSVTFLATVLQKAQE